MLCRLCCKYNEVCKRMVWLTIACKLLRNDKLSGHDATPTLPAEAITTAAKRSGGIVVCLE